MASNKCKKCKYYIVESDKQDGVTERFCGITYEQVNGNWSCPDFEYRNKRNIDNDESIYRTEWKAQL